MLNYQKYERVLSVEVISVPLLDTVHSLNTACSFLFSADVY